MTGQSIQKGASDSRNILVLGWLDLWNWIWKILAHSPFPWESSVQSFSCVRLFATPWTAAHQASLSIINFWSLFTLMSIELVMPSNHLFSDILFSSRLPSSPASGSFQMSQFFAAGGQSIGVSASASVFPMNTQD